MIAVEGGVIAKEKVVTKQANTVGNPNPAYPTSTFHSNQTARKKPAPFTSNS